MQKKTLVMIMSPTGSLIRQVTVSRYFLFFIGLLFVGCIVYCGFLARNYSILKAQFPETMQMEKMIKCQNLEMDKQKKQIKEFMSKIEGLQIKLTELNNFERKIRIVANIENDSDSIFGVGGSTPSTMDCNAKLFKNHTDLLDGMRQHVDQLEKITKTQQNGFKSLLKHLSEKRNFLASTPSIYPTKGWVSSKFGYRVSPITGNRSFHQGLDIAAHKGTSVIAAADGIVSFAGRKGRLGNLIVLDHGHGIVTRYGHLYKILVKNGEQVKRGNLIGQVGSTGRSTGSHLHYEVHASGIPVNPETYILN